jgi:triphosphoribosyl-dephospho-CoA synthase
MGRTVPPGSRALSPAEIALCAQAACLLEVAAPKPGNVSRHHDFGDTAFEDFLLSAAAVGGALGAAGDNGVGATVLQAVRDTRRWTKANTNLGILLLLAPLARAAAQPGGPLRERLSGVLSALSIADARAVYAAIRLAEPGGLGNADEQDVRGEPTVSLREAMALAAERDTIAREYVTDYEVTFGLAVPALRRARAGDQGWSTATLECFLGVLSEVPDTLIARKRGPDAARVVSGRARQVLAAGLPGSPERARATEAFDVELRRPDNRLNPGTTADLVAAALFVVLTEEL